MTCQHELVYWFPALGACNERGWKCACGHLPGEPPGYSPQLDAARLRTKIWCILHEVADAHIVYVSNSDEGEGITDEVARTVEASGNRDQYSIVLAILQAMTPSHAAYWREVGDGVRAGKDERNRCACGQLSTSSRHYQGKSFYSCGAEACEKGGLW